MSGRPPRKRVKRVPLASSAFRLRIFVLLVAILFSVAGARAIQIQVLGAEAMAKEAADQMTVARKLPATRGQITDRNGRVLATTEDTVDVVADPQMISVNGKDNPSAKDLDRGAVAPQEIAAIIARRTGANAVEIEEKLRRSDTRWQKLVAQIPSSTWVELSAELSSKDNEGGRYVGIFRESNPRRIYPLGTVASNIVGYVSQGSGLGGIERTQEELLAGVEGKEIYETSPNGKIPLGNQTLTPAVDGKDVQLTIDADFQFMVEKRLAQQVDQAQGNWGLGLVMDVETGELLALANYPSFDSNNPGAGDVDDLQNRAVMAAYEPGSVQKVLTLASLIDAGLTTPDTTYPIEQTIKVGSHTVKDAFTHGDIDITTRGILVKSSNVGAITAARQMDSDRLRQYMLDFGLGQKTNLGLPGEAAGIVPDAGMPAYTADSMAYGYGVSVTSVQMAAAVAAIANGGVYTAPSIIRATGDADGHLTEAATPESRRVISEEAAQQVVEMMEQRTIDSMDKIGVPGYRTGSKTGSARLSGSVGGYSGQVASMIGVGPVEDPKILVYVLIARPDTMGAGLGMAGPAYRDIMSLALPYYGIPATSSVPTDKLPLVKEK